MGECLICREPAVERRLEFGPQPVSSHFAASSDDDGVGHDVSLGICGACGVVQLMRPFPFTALVSPFDWFTYREPEGHLDDLVEKILALPQETPRERVLGVSVKDDTTVKRFADRGAAAAKTLDAQKDMGIAELNAGVESVQHHLTRAFARTWAEVNGKWDVVIARHIVEHAENPMEFLAALSELTEDGGYLVVEVPDCQANLERQDVTMVWEEHTLYFTPETFRAAIQRAGFEEVLFENYLLTYENCLVVVGRKRARGRIEGKAPGGGQARASQDATGIFERYVDGVHDWQARYRAYLERCVAAGERIALYGAGHLSCAFVSYYGFADLIAFVVDDTPQKQGLFLPGSGLPIVPASHLEAEGVTLCLLSLSPDVEEKVMAKNAAFQDAGGRFRSIFAASSRSLRNDL